MRSAVTTVAAFILGCSASHGREGITEEAVSQECEITDGPLEGIFDGRPWRLAWGQDWPFGSFQEMQVFGEEIEEPRSCWPTPPRDRIYITRGAPAGVDERERRDGVSFLVAGTISYEHEATTVRIEVLDAPIDRVRLGICARDDSGEFSVSGIVEAAECSP